MAENNDDHTDYEDGREVGEWASRYDRGAWLQIILEFILLLIYLLLPGYILFDAVVERSADINKDGFIYSNLLRVYIADERAKWVALALAGFIGGSVFDLKWMYHSVAKGIWNRDRCLWRIVVPFNSAMVSLFTGFLFASGMIPFLKNEVFEDTYTLLGFGFIFGYFSDNILAALQNLAKKVFGTLDDD